MGIWRWWRARHPRRYVGAEWSNWDALVVVVAFVLFALGAVDRFYVWLSFVVVGAFAVVWTARHVLRRRRERVTDATSVFWADQIKP